MYLDYSKIKITPNELPEQPDLLLQTLSDKNIGFLQGVSNLRFDIGYSELSEISFTIPYFFNGVVNPLYKDTIGYKIVYTKNYGIYVITNPEITGDGINEEKNVHGYSIEKLFERKDFFLSEGVYNFYDPLNSEDTVLGMLISLDKNWEIGYVSPTLINKYRTFDQYKNNALSFLYGDLIEKYNCFVVCDTYKNKNGKRTINFYDTESDLETVPIYLSYENLVDQVKVSEATDELVTQLSVYGADGLSIRDVNPIGSDYIVNLDYFIDNGDIDPFLATRIKEWEKLINSNKEYYSTQISLRASSTSLKIATEAKKVDLEGKRTDNKNQQSVIIQAIALETTEAGKAKLQEQLDGINAEIEKINAEIVSIDSEISSINNKIEEYKTNILEIIKKISYENFFSSSERTVLDNYLIQGDITDETFVSSDIDAEDSGVLSEFSGTLSVRDGKIVQSSYSSTTQKEIFAIKGGKLKVDSIRLDADIIRATLEIDTTNSSYVFSSQLGKSYYGDSIHPSGLFTSYGKFKNWTSDCHKVEGEIPTVEGTSIDLASDLSNVYFTVNVSEYQKYSVEKELYDYGIEVLAEKSFPTYEFDISTSNFIFQDKFAPYKNSLELGKGIYLILGSMGRIVPRIIGISFGFDDISSIDITFSNKFQRIDGQKILREVIEKTYSSSKNFDAKKYVYNQSASKSVEVSKFMNSSLDSAVNSIVNSKNQSVEINGAGIQVGGDDKYQIRIVDRMIALTDDNWKTAKLAIGNFSSDTLGSYFGINADVIAGKLIVGNNLEIECPGIDKGVIQFKVDSSGAWLNNATFVLQKDNGGKILIDPKYGIVAGPKNVLTVSGTSIAPSFIDVDGKIILDKDGIPQNANFYLDAQDGKAYFRGKVVAGAGDIGGWSVDPGKLYSGSGSTYVALSSSADTPYAIWAGSQAPESASFSVQRNGTVSMKGSIDASEFKIKGKSALTSETIPKLSGSSINAKGILVKDTGNQTTFSVDQNGNVIINGKVTMGSGSSINWAQVNETNLSSSLAYNKASNAETTANNTNSALNDLTYMSGSQTYIDGSKIWTKSLGAESITADKIRLLGNMTVYEGYTGAAGGELGYTDNESTSGVYNPAIHIAKLVYDRYSRTEIGGEVVASETGSKLICKNAYNSIDQVYVTEDTIGLSLDDGRTGVQLKNQRSLREVFFAPIENGGAYLGTSGYRWNQIFYIQGSIGTSDRNQKKDISYNLANYEKLFYKLKPVSYKFKDGESGRVHTGFISQDIEDALKETGISPMDFAAFCKDTTENGNPYYGLRYEEFISLNTYMIQKAMKKIDVLEKRILELTGGKG